MRLLIVSDTFPPDINGVARTLHQLANGLADFGHHVSIVTTCQGESDERFQRHIVTSVPLPGYSVIRLGFASMAWFAALFEQTRTEVLYVATETALGIAAIWAARRAGIPVVSGFHTNFHTYMRSYHLTALERVAESFLAAIHNQTFRTLAPSAHTAQLLEQMGVASVAVMGRGVNSELFHPQCRAERLRAEWAADERTPVILHVGRLAEEKNLPMLEQAVAAFTEVHPNARCVIVGDGPSGATLRKTHPDWIFTGMLSGEILAKHYASADVFLFPSLTETFGNVVTEAMSSGLVTVAYDYAAAHEYIRHRENGLLCAVDEPGTFPKRAQEAALLWDNHAIRTHARATAEDLSWSSITRCFEQHLEQAIQSQIAKQAARLL